VLTTVNALVQKVPPRTAFQGSALLLRKGGRADIEDITRFLDSNGYNRTGTVMEPGEYAVRGGILDLFPSGESEPMRLDLFGDEIESIRRLDTGTQRSGAALDRLTLRPVGEVFLDQPSIERFRAQYRELFGNAAAEDPLYVSISAGRRHPGMEHWAGLFHDHMETLLDYLPGASVSLDAQAGEALAARLEMIDDHYEARRIPARISEGEVPYRPAPPKLLYLDQAGWDRMLAGGKRLNFSPFHKPDGAPKATTPAAAPAGSSPRSARPARTSSPPMARMPRRSAAAAGSRCSRPGRAARASGWSRCCGKTASPPSPSRTSTQFQKLKPGSSASASSAWSAASPPSTSPSPPSRTCSASASPARPAARSAPTSSSPTPPRSRWATCWSTRTTASAATTASPPSRSAAPRTTACG
jgi:transcription-repair coupling factor (superfamily II helicase)